MSAESLHRFPLPRSLKETVTDNSDARMRPQHNQPEVHPSKTY